MTRKEAREKINWLYYEADYGFNLPDDMEMAVDMAIEALAQPEVIRCEYCKHAKSVDSESWIRCDLSGSYELREWYCGSARRREE